MPDEFEMMFSPMKIGNETFSEEKIVDFKGGFVISTMERAKFEREINKVINKYRI